MNLYLWIKTLHIISSVVLVGTGFGSAFYLFMTHRSGSVAAQAVVSRLVVKADWWMTTPAVIVQPLSGLAMAHHGWLAVETRRGLRSRSVCMRWPGLVLVAGRGAADPHGAAGGGVGSARGDAALPEAYWTHGSLVGKRWATRRLPRCWRCSR